MSAAQPSEHSVSTLIRGGPAVPVGTPAPTKDPVDIRICGGMVGEVATGWLRPRRRTCSTRPAGGAVPGRWDQHVHMFQWAQTQTRLDRSRHVRPIGGRPDRRCAHRDTIRERVRAHRVRLRVPLANLGAPAHRG